MRNIIGVPSMASMMLYTFTHLAATQCSHQYRSLAHISSKVSVLFSTNYLDLYIYSYIDRYIDIYIYIYIYI